LFSWASPFCIWRAAWLEAGGLLCLVAETVALLPAELLDEVGVWATASMDTKPVNRKMLIININFFIVSKFLG
jgi:hypothetical protein